MSEELKKTRGETEKHVKRWLDRLETANQVAPIVRQAYELITWESKAIDSMPEAASEIPHDDLLSHAYTERDLWCKSLPTMPVHNYPSLNTSGTASLASASTIYQFAILAGDLSDPSVQAWSQTYTAEYEEIQQTQMRVGAVGKLLGRLNPDRAIEFNEAVTTYQGLDTGLSDRVGVGIKLRNVLEHYKGDLFERTINRPSEQKITWVNMAARLTVGSGDGPESQMLLHAEKQWTSLHRRLTDVAKNLRSGAATNLRTIFTEWLDHLYTVLSLIDPAHL